ncbi:MAG: hypothetical protein MPN21_14985 [Thermoanaerobaculia bacterium]|nr:hypothetical protein [Thermoanaerobaculia bacterium]
MVTVNGVDVGSVEPAKNFGTPQTVEAPAEVWREGPNIIAFEHSVTAVPSLHSQRRDGRPLGSSWNGVALRGIADSRAPTREDGSGTEAPTLHLPYGSQVAYYLRLRAGSELHLPDIRGAGRLGGPG